MPLRDRTLLQLDKILEFREKYKKHGEYPPHVVTAKACGFKNAFSITYRLNYPKYRGKYREEWREKHKPKVKEEDTIKILNKPWEPTIIGL